MAINYSTDDYGFEGLEVVTEEGGRLTITFYGGKTDIAGISSMNPHGLGHSEYIRGIEHIDKAREDVFRTTWLNSVEKEHIQNFLGHIATETAKTIVLLDRFDVKAENSLKEGEEDLKIYTFTEKANSQFTQHAKVSISVTIPKMWTYENAWQALTRILNPGVKPAVTTTKQD